MRMRRIIITSTESDREALKAEQKGRYNMLLILFLPLTIVFAVFDCAKKSGGRRR